MRCLFIAIALNVVVTAQAITVTGTNTATGETVTIHAADPVLGHWSEDRKPIYVKLDSRVYPVTATNDIEYYSGLILFDPAQVRNCRRPGGAAATHSALVFVGASGAGYVYLSGLQQYKIYPTVLMLDLHSTDGDLVCDNPLPNDPSDPIFINGYEQIP